MKQIVLSIFLLKKLKKKTSSTPVPIGPPEFQWNWNAWQFMKNNIVFLWSQYLHAFHYKLWKCASYKHFGMLLISDLGLDTRNFPSAQFVCKRSVQRCIVCYIFSIYLCILLWAYINVKSLPTKHHLNAHIWYHL